MTTESYDPSAYNVVDMTPGAINHFTNVAGGKFLKFGIIGGGCSGFQYHWEIYDEEQDHFEGDEVVDYGSFKLYVDNYSLPYLAGTTVDFVTDLQGSRVEIQNPNTTGGCGCGESVMF